MWVRTAGGGCRSFWAVPGPTQGCVHSGGGSALGGHPLRTPRSGTCAYCYVGPTFLMLVLKWCACVCVQACAGRLVAALRVTPTATGKERR